MFLAYYPTRNRNVVNTSCLFSEALVRMQTLKGRDVFVFLFLFSTMSPVNKETRLYFLVFEQSPLKLNSASEPRKDKNT